MRVRVSRMAALSPVIGYDKASAVARIASNESTTLRQAALVTTESAGRARRAENRSGGRSPLQVGNDPLQALPPPIHVQQGLGLVEDPVVFDGSGHDLRVSPGLAGLRPELPRPVSPP